MNSFGFTVGTRRTKMLFSEVPIWVGGEELKPGDLISVDLGRLLGERNVEYVGVYSDVMTGVRGILGKIDGKVLPLGSVTIFRGRATTFDKEQETES